MIRAIYRNGKIEPINGIPAEWEDGEELTVEQAERFLGPDDPIPDLEERLAELHALGPMEFEPGEKQAMEQLWKEIDDQEQGDIENAIHCFVDARRAKPDFAPAHYNLGRAFHHQGDVDQAATCYQRAIELKLEYVEAYNNLGVV